MHKAFARLRALLGVFGAVHVCTACSAQKSADYEGEPLVILQGNVVMGPDAIPAAVHVVLAWDNFVRDGDIVTSERAAIRGSFPARFRLEVLAPPHPRSFNDFTLGGLHADEVPVAVANIVALEPNARQEQLDSVAVGIVEDYILVYAAADVRRNTVVSALLHGALSKGFHLMKVIRFSPEQEQALLEEREACYRARAGEDPWSVRIACGSDYIYDELHEVPLGTEVTLRLAATRSLDWPNYH